MEAIFIDSPNRFAATFLPQAHNPQRRTGSSIARYSFLNISGVATRFDTRRKELMLETLAVILILLWVLGFATSYTLGGLIHILLVIALIIVILRVIRGRGSKS